MSDAKNTYDIFICGGSQHFTMLQSLLPKLHPFGRVHLVSITLTHLDLHTLRQDYDVLHTPRHDTDGYVNFNLFCIRDINCLATAPHFIKLDADVSLQDNWIAYVDRGVREHDPVLFGIKEGLARVNVALYGPLVRKKFGRDIRVSNRRKVIGGFYVGHTAFFQQHDAFMQSLHEFLYCFRDGRRCRPSLQPTAWPQAAELANELFTLAGDVGDLQRIGNEDTLRSLVVHALGAGERLFVLDSQGSIQVPHGPEAASPG